MSKRAILFLTIWLVLLACGFAVDLQVKSWLYAHRFHDEAAGVFRGTWWALSVKAMGDIRFAMAVAGVLVAARLLSWRRGVLLVICAASSLVNEALKWFFGRARPFSDNGLTGWFQFRPFAPDFAAAKAFPSGHAMLAFATAACLARYYPKWRWLFYGMAGLVAAQRVLDLSHHVSDVIAAAGIGIMLTTLCFRLLPGLWKDQEMPTTAELEKRVG